MASYGRRRRRRYRRRYYRKRYLRPRSLGTSKNNVLRACFTVQNKVNIPVSSGMLYPNKHIFITPFYGNIIPYAFVTNYGQCLCLNSCFDSYTFRKLSTVYTEIKCDGMIAKITPVAGTANYQSVHVNCVWDRSTGQNTWNNYGDNMNANRLIRDIANEQGGFTHIINDSKGRSSVYTRCYPRTMTERSTYTPLRVGHSAQAISSGSSTKYHTFNLAPMYYASQIPTTAFNPGLFVGFEFDENPVTNVDLVVCMQVKYYISFRAPGLNMTSNDVVALLLKDNEDIRPYVEGAKGEFAGFAIPTNPRYMETVIPGYESGDDVEIIGPEIPAESPPIDVEQPTEPSAKKVRVSVEEE